jgi:myosin-1
MSTFCVIKLMKQALNVNPCEEGDPIFTCNFKTEMICALLTINGGNLAVNIGPTYDNAPLPNNRADE